MKNQKKKNWGGGGGRGGQGGCDRRIEVFGKIHQKNFLEGVGGGWVGGVGVGLVGTCQGGCERRIEVFVKIQKKKNGGGGWVGGGGGGRVGGGVRVDVNEELKFL